MKDGTVKMNPGYDNPNIVETVGPTDPDIAALFADSRWPTDSHPR